MKKQLLTILFCLAATSVLNTKSNGQVLIHYWNFNTFTSTVTLPAIASIPADYSTISSPMATLIYKPIPGTSSGFSDYCDPVTPSAGSPDFDTVNARMSAPSGNAFRARNPSDSMEILLYMPSTGYSNLTISYGCELSSYTSGDSVNVFAYSVDSAATWITSGTGLSEWVDSGSISFKLISVHINDPLAYNNRKFVFRITTMGRNSGSSGNNRYDNITLDGILGGPSSVTSVNTNNTPDYTLFPNPVSNNLRVNSNTEGEKSITILNVLGQKVYEVIAVDQNFTVNTSEINPGIYYLNIKENSTGVVTTKKFVKQ